MRAAVLEGVRVVEFGQAWAGPFAARLLGDLGAEVIKVEAPRHPDLVRFSIYVDNEPGDRPWERGAHYQKYGRNKKSCVLDLAGERGNGLFFDLLAASDVFIDNFTPRARGQLGITPEAVAERCPNLVWVSMPGFGESGPYRDYLGYGLTLEGFSGLSSVTGYDDGRPVRSSVPYGDPVAASYGALAALAGLRHRAREGRGTRIELSQHEGLTSLLPDLFLRTQIEGAPPRPAGNDDALLFAPHGAFPCRGENAWVALSVASDAQWHALCDLAGAPGLRGRSSHEERDTADVHDAIAAWTRQRSPAEAADALQDAGIAAAPVLSPARMIDHEQVRALGLYEDVPHPLYRALPYARAPFRVHGVPAEADTHAPLFGEHTREVLSTVLGLDDAEIDELYAAGVTADAPDMA